MGNNQLLDENKSGLISQAIKFIEILPEGTNLGKGTKEELIEKLKKFKSLLESINENTEELTEEEKEEIEKKVDEETHNDNEQEGQKDTERIPPGRNYRADRRRPNCFSKTCCRASR